MRCLWRQRIRRCCRQLFDNLHFNDFFWNGGLISFSFTFVPMLLFRVIKTGVQTGIKLSQQIGRLLGITREATVTAVQYLDNTQQRNDQPVENSLPSFFLFSNKL